MEPMPGKISKTVINNHKSLYPCFQIKRMFCVNEKNLIMYFYIMFNFNRCKVKFTKLFRNLNLMTGVLPN